MIASTRAAARALRECGAEFGELIRVAGSDDFHMTVVGVLDPSAQADLGGLAMDEPTEAYPLDAAFDEESDGLLAGRA